MIGGIVLAGGESRRMGQSKMLLPFDGKTVIECAVDAMLEGGVDEVVVVLGHEPDAKRAVLGNRPVKVVLNESYKEGMLSSVRCGLMSLGETVEWIAVLPGDHPQVSAEVVKKLITATATTRTNIIVPVNRGRRGHPILFRAGYKAEVLTEFDDLGLRGLLSKHAGTVLEVEIEDGGILVDVNTPEEYAKVLR